MTDLKTMLMAEIEKNLDRPAIIICNINPVFLNEKFSNSFGGYEWQPFVAHTDDFVYFTQDYDGAVVVRSVPRGPDKSSFNVMHYNEM